MRQLIQKIDWNKFRIRRKQDWVIFWIFAALACYVLGLADHRPDRWLLRFANPYMSDLNQPHTWGQLIPFLVLFTVVVEVVLFLCKKPVKARVLVLAGALLMPMVILAGYRIHTNLIVSSLWKEKPAGIRLWKEKGMELTGEEQQELLELCRNLTIISDRETQEQLEQWYRESDTAFMDADEISIWFSEKYGHNYSFNLRVYEGKVFLWRGYSGSDGEEEITFFEDNGIVEWVDGIDAP
ncbi:MAG: hypothetical protein NC121_13295 [Blautia sp.]|nr:hypothetical protein [Blautia sp.]